MELRCGRIPLPCASSSPTTTNGTPSSSPTSCTVRLDDNLTSLVAVFSPLRLGVKFSGGSDGATVTANPPGQTCDDDLDDSHFCAMYAPHTRVALTLTPGMNPFRGWNESTDANYLCEPTGSTTCTIVVVDEPVSSMSL